MVFVCRDVYSSDHGLHLHKLESIQYVTEFQDIFSTGYRKNGFTQPENMTV